MKTLKDFINESIINEATNVKSTVKDYILWHYNLDDEKDFTFDKFSEKDFDVKALKKYFDNDKEKMYKELVNLMKNDKQIKIDSSWRGNDILTKFKADKFTFNALSDNGTKWAPERALEKFDKTDGGATLTSSNQLYFKNWAMSKMDNEGILDKVLKKYDLNRRSFKYRSYGLVGFDHVTAFDTLNDNQNSIKDVKCDGSMTFDEAYDNLLKYYKVK